MTPNPLSKPAESKYWICGVCEMLEKLISKYPNGGNTLCTMKCDWCGKELICTPIVDFKESGSKSWD